jgi:hypothetical protein
VPTMQPVPNVLRITYGFTVGDDTDVTSKTHYTWSGTAPSASTCVTLAGDIYAEAALEFAGLMSITTYLTSVRVTDLTSTTAGDGTHAALTVGSRAGDQLPASTCVVINRQIARRYRGGKPRAYVPFGVINDLQTAQTWTSAFQTAVNNGHSTLDTYIRTLAVAGCTLGTEVTIAYYGPPYTIHTGTTGRVRNVPTARVPPIVDTVIGSGASLTLGSQRRRVRRG